MSGLACKACRFFSIARFGWPLGDRIAAAGNGHKLPGLREFSGSLGDFNGAFAEGLHLERPDRAVPNQRLSPRQRGDHGLDAAGADVEDHVARADRIDRDDARGGFGLELLRHHGIDRQRGRCR